MVRRVREEIRAVGPAPQGSGHLRQLWRERRGAAVRTDPTVTPALRAVDGHESWVYLHHKARVAKSDPASQRKVFRLAQEVVNGLECGSCGEHGGDWMRANPFDPSKETIEQYLCRFHNIVNQHVGNPVQPCPVTVPTISFGNIEGGGAHGHVAGLAEEPGKPCVECDQTWDNVMSQIGVAHLAQPGAEKTKSPRQLPAPGKVRGPAPTAKAPPPPTRAAPAGPTFDPGEIESILSASLR